LSISIQRVSSTHRDIFYIKWLGVVQDHLEMEIEEEKKKFVKRRSINVRVQRRARKSHLYYLFLENNPYLSDLPEGQWVSIGDNFIYGSLWTNDKGISYIVTDRDVSSSHFSIKEADELQLLNSQKEAFSSLFEHKGIRLRACMKAYLSLLLSPP
jgi:hypothetical protein